MTTDDICMYNYRLFQLKNGGPILSKTESQYKIDMCQHPEHKVNVSGKGVLCVLDYSKLFETPRARI